VDGFNEHETAGETDDGGIAYVCLFAAHGDPLEALEFADRLLDPRPEFVETFWKETAPMLGVLATGNHRRDAARKGGGAVCVAVIPFVGHRDARADVWADVERGLELRAVAGLAAGQVEVERTAVEIGLEVNFGRETAARAPEGLVLLPPFAPAAET